MAPNKILIAGGTGFIGQALIDDLVRAGCELVILSRSSRKSQPHITYFLWDVNRQFIDCNAFADVDVIINLAGAGIADKHWTKARKEAILESRVASTQLLFNTISKYRIPIKTYISASAVGYYGMITTDQIFNEEAPNGTDFLAEVCNQWEEAVSSFKKIGVRTVVLRQGLVIGMGQGILKKMVPLARLGLNVALGSGKQYMPWISIVDLVRIYKKAIFSTDFEGVYNAVAPQHVDMNMFSKLLLASFHKKSFLPNVPAFIIKLLFGEMSSMLLEGSRVSADKILNTPFKFEYPTLEDAFNSAVASP